MYKAEQFCVWCFMAYNIFTFISHFCGNDLPYNYYLFKLPRVSDNAIF